MKDPYKPNHPGLKINKVPTSECPICGYEMDAATSASGGEHIPQPGNLSICLMCCNPLIFGEDLVLRVLTDQEVSDLKGDEESWDYLQKVIGYAKSVNLKSK